MRTTSLPSMVLQLQSKQVTLCMGLDVIPVNRPTQLAIVSDKSNEGHNQAVGLFVRVLRTLITISSGSIAKVPCGGQGRFPETCMIAGQPDARRILVVVGTDQIINNISSLQGWSDTNGNLLSSHLLKVVPVLKEGAKPGSILPKAIQKCVVSFYNKHASEATADILNRAEISTNAYRLFISYRHEDSAAIAEQLFDKLSKRGFDVFLDRFRGRPGDNFLRRIHEELIDKACVLFLESENIYRSSYVLGENNFANIHRLGRIMINLPNAPKLPGIHGERIHIDKSKIIGAGKSISLNDAALDRVQDSVLSNYHSQISHRPKYMANLLYNALIYAGISPFAQNDPIPFIIGSQQGAGGEYHVLPVSRPPSATHLQRICGIANKHSGKGVVIGPFRFHDSENADAMQWISQLSNIVAQDENDLLRAAVKMKGGTL